MYASYMNNKNYLTTKQNTLKDNFTEKTHENRFDEVL